MPILLNAAVIGGFNVFWGETVEHFTSLTVARFRFEELKSLYQ